MLRQYKERQMYEMNVCFSYFVCGSSLLTTPPLMFHLSVCVWVRKFFHVLQVNARADLRLQPRNFFAAQARNEDIKK